MLNRVLKCVKYLTQFLTHKQKGSFNFCNSFIYSKELVMKFLGSLVLLVFISACGGGGGTVSSTPPASSTPTTDPTSKFEDSKFGSSTFN